MFMLHENVIKRFALTANITPNHVDSAIAALIQKGYNVGLLDRSGGGICFLYNDKDVGHDIRWTSESNCDNYPVTEHNPFQPPWHDSNNMLVQFKTCSESPVSWTAEKVANVVATLVECFPCVENVIENEQRMYDPNVDSDLLHNIFCKIDYKAALGRWTVKHHRFPEETLLTCHLCRRKWDPSYFLWESQYKCEPFTDLEEVLARFEMNTAPCCFSCLRGATACSTPRPETCPTAVAYVEDIYKTECSVHCPMCSMLTQHSVGPENTPVADRTWKLHLCSGCGGAYQMMPSYSISVHTDPEIYIDRINVRRLNACNTSTKRDQQNQLSKQITNDQRPTD
jgi:hypothetical protein